MSNLAETILQDVPRYGCWELDSDAMRASTDGRYIELDAVLAAITAAMDPAIAERAGEVAKRLRAVCTCNIDSSPCMAEDDCRDAISAADLITALLTANAALRAERDEHAEALKVNNAVLCAALLRAKDAEAQIAALPAATVGVPLKQIGTGLYETQPTPDHAAIREAWGKAYWRMRSYAVHDNDCKLNKPPHFNGPCSCGLTATLEEALALISKGATEPTEYERKVAQMKKDFPNGI